MSEIPAAQRCAIVATQGYEAPARLLADQLSLSFLDNIPQEPPSSAAFSWVLVLSERGLGLQLTGPKAPGAIYCDFVEGANAHRRKFGGGKKQDLSRAVGLDKRANLQVFDLTAGLGRDAFVLASLGATVNLVERNPVVHALLADGIERARLSDDGELVTIARRMNLQQGSAQSQLEAMADDSAEVIYLDPMFPGRQKSAKVKKEMQAFHALVGTDEDSDNLLSLAIKKSYYRAVVKRPASAPFLAELAPSYSLTGKSTRFDIYTKRSLTSDAGL